MPFLVRALALLAASFHLAATLAPCPPQPQPDSAPPTHGAHAHAADAGSQEAEPAPRVSGACGCGEDEAGHLSPRPLWAEPPPRAELPTPGAALAWSSAAPSLPDAPSFDNDPVPI